MRLLLTVILVCISTPMFGDDCPKLAGSYKSLKNPSTFLIVKQTSCKNIEGGLFHNGVALLNRHASIDGTQQLVYVTSELRKLERYSWLIDKLFILGEIQYIKDKIILFSQSFISLDKDKNIVASSSITDVNGRLLSQSDETFIRQKN